jgi:hypothetical protein
VSKLEEKKKKRKKKTMKENMIKMKWLYSSRNSTSSSRKEYLTREKGKRNQGQRGCATIAVRMCTSLPNAHMRGRKKTMTREKSLTKDTRKIRNTLRRSLVVKLMLVKNGTEVIRVPSQKVMSGNHSYQGQNLIKQVTLPQGLKAYMPHGKRR